jgi:hypothetical protein
MLPLFFKIPIVVRLEPDPDPFCDIGCFEDEEVFNNLNSFSILDPL